MIKPLTLEQRQQVDEILENMTLEEKIGQVQCLNGGGLSSEKIKELIKEEHIGAFFAGNMDKEELKQLEQACSDSKIPIIINGDLVNGAGSRIFGLTGFPQQMGCSAANDMELTEKMGYITAQEGRAYGASWTFGPVSDLCYNLQNPMMHIRTSGDRPDQVLRMSRAFIRGVQETGYMAATAKHFPGDGTDSRDSHITTLVNNLSREQWEQTYGVIWRGVIDAGVMCVMSGHIALPWVDPEYEQESERYKGPRPASLSKKILVDFLRGELGFEGVVVTDALNMVGLGAHMKRCDYAPKLLNAGNDMLLWTKPEIDSFAIRKALQDGTLSYNRLQDAVKKILELKARVGLLGGGPAVPTPEEIDLAANAQAAQTMADKSISVLRDIFHAIPCRDLTSGDRVLTITLTFVEGIRNTRDGKELTVIDEMLRERGYQVDHLLNPDGIGCLDQIAKDYKKIFVNFKYPARYGSIRLYGEAISALKGSWWVENPDVIFTAFGDPFKIYDLPSLPSYVAAYSIREPSLRAAVKVWLGEIEPQGVCPIDMASYL